MCNKISNLNNKLGRFETNVNRFETNVINQIIQGGGQFTTDIINQSSPSTISLDTSFTFFDNPSSFSLDGSQLPQYTLPDPMQDTRKGLSLLNPLSGNVAINTSQGAFNLTFDDKDSELVFVDGLWRQIGSPPWYVKNQQGSKLVGSNVVGTSDQGVSVSLSADGNILAIGGPNDRGGQGAVWIFIRNGISWMEQIKIEITDNIGNSRVGTSVSLSADGNTLAIGGSEDNSGEGAIWIWIRTGNIWSQEAKFGGNDVSGMASQGQSVSLSADGNTVAFGGPLDNLEMGATWIFTRSGSTWTQQGNKIVGGGSIGLARQGTSVSLSGDGNTLAIGAFADDNFTGATWIFTRSGSMWIQQNKLIGGSSIGSARQGISVSLSVDGNTLAIGGTTDNTDIGAVWIFVRRINIWEEQIKLIGTGGINSNQGRSVSLSSDGNTLAFGGSRDDFETGATWIFTRTSSGVWTQQGNKLIGTPTAGLLQQGRSISLSARGDTLALGAPSDNSNIGATWIFI